MSKRLLNAILIAIFLATPLCAIVLPKREVMSREKRYAAPFPERPRFRQREVKRYFIFIDAFFADRFPLREKLLGVSSLLYGAMEASPNSDKCFRGKDDWLFTGNSYGGFVDKFQGLNPITPESLLELKSLYLYRKDAATKRGADFLIIISPEKISVYPEMRPLYIIEGKERYTAPLIKALSELGVNIADPTDRMITLKKPGESFYYRTDTHWNLLGGYVGFELVRELYGLPPLPPFKMESMPPKRGDLINVAGYTSFPLHPGDNFEPIWDPPLEITRLETGDIAGAEAFLNPEAPLKKTVWMFADSSNYSIRPYFLAMFREVRIFWQIDFDRMMASSDPGPDLVVWLTVERGLDKRGG